MMMREKITEQLRKRKDENYVLSETALMRHFNFQFIWYIYIFRSFPLQLIQLKSLLWDEMKYHKSETTIYFLKQKKCKSY